MTNKTKEQAEHLLNLIDKQTHSNQDMLFSDALKQLNLDGSDASLERIGSFLLNLRAKGWFINAIMDKTGGFNFLVGLAVYIGRYIAQQVGATPVWLNYHEAIRAFPNHELPEDFFTSLVIDVNKFVVLPLGAISEYLSQHVGESEGADYTPKRSIAQYTKLTVKKIQNSNDRNINDWCAVYLHSFKENAPMPGGMAYKDRLDKLNLDGSLASFTAIDGMLADLATELKNNEASYLQFVNDELKANFLVFLAFYLGTHIAKHANSSIKWFDYADAKTMLGDDFVKTFEHSNVFVLSERFHLPLYPIVFRLFPFLTKGQEAAAQTCLEYAKHILANEQGYLTSYTRDAMQKAVPKLIDPIWQKAMSAAGFLAAFSADNAVEGNAVSPRKIVPGDGDDIDAYNIDGEKATLSAKMTIVDGMFLENAVDSFYEDINVNNGNHSFQVFCYDMYANLPTGRTDGIAIEIRCYGNNPLSLQLIQPYRHAEKPEGFALYPVVTNQAHMPNSIHELINQFYTAALDFKSPFNGNFWQDYYIAEHDLFATVANNTKSNSQNNHNNNNENTPDVQSLSFKPITEVAQPFLLPMGNFTSAGLDFLHSFLQNLPIEGGVRFEKQLRSCQLDFSLASLRRLDKFLAAVSKHIEEKQITDFVTAQDGTNLIVIITVYVGEIAARLLGKTARWFTVDAFEGTGLFVGKQREPYYLPFFVLFNDDLPSATKDNSQVFEPVKVLARFLHADKNANENISAFNYVTALIDVHHHHAGYLEQLDKPLPPAPSISLPIDINQEIQKLEPHQRNYLQILGATWLKTDELYKQMQMLPKLYTQGRVVWAALIQGNNVLFSPEEPVSCPGEVLYDPTGRTPPSSLVEFAHQLFELKNGTAKDAAQKHYGEHLKNERTRLLGHDFPQSIAALPLKMSSTYFWRMHLPNVMLSLSYFPILIADDCEGAVTLLPARFWPKAFYDAWLEVAKQEHGKSFDIMPSILQKEYARTNPFEDISSQMYPADLRDIFPTHHADLATAKQEKIAEEVQAASIDFRGDNATSERDSAPINANELFMNAMNVIKNPDSSNDEQFTQAMQDLQQAVRLDHVRAKRELGWLYFCGIPEGRNQEGLSLLLQAANANDAKAQMLMAGLHFQDEYGYASSDPEEGYKWLVKAAENGDADAQEMLDSLLKQSKSKTSFITWVVLAGFVLFILSVWLF